MTGVSLSRAIYAGNGKLLRLTLAADGQFRLWAPLAEISPLLIQAVLQYEDRWFYYHPGVNPLALGRALRSLWGLGHRRLGGSTISMQLARRIYSIDSRKTSGKLWQIAAALWLEATHSKDEILETYLNLAPYGGNIEGIGAASRLYFGKQPNRLAPPEAFALALLPQNPNQRARALKSPKSDPHFQRLREALSLRLLASQGAIVDERLARLDVRLNTDSAPFLAPHFVDQVLAHSPGAGDLSTTLDPTLQRLCERQVRQFVESRRHFGVENAAAILVDTRDMGVRALVGSADFFDNHIEGQVNATGARRSPGSVLKPFVYALGIEQGVIHPRSILRDTPVTFSTYSPENFDGHYVGPLTATEALIRSRNIPALLVAAKLDRPTFYQFLVGAGVDLPQSESYYGLGLVLGTGEVTMEEVAVLYSALANQGRLRPLRHLQADRPVPGLPILSKEAVWLVLDMLAKNPRPAGAPLVTAHPAPPLPWKTGTSWGFRDAWSAGLVGPYTLVIWVGDFRGRSNPAFVGIETAAPLYFGIVDALLSDRTLASSQGPRPASIVSVPLCSESGHLPNSHCPHHQPGWFFPGHSPTTTCTVHREFEIDPSTGKRVCNNRGRREVFEIWPSDLLKLFAAAGLPRRPLPPLVPECDDHGEADGQPPRITSPLGGAIYGLRPGREQVAFIAETDGDAREVFWYIGRQFAGKSPIGRPFFWTMTPGTYVIRAVDDRGRSDSQVLRVELEP